MNKKQMAVVAIVLLIALLIGFLYSQSGRDATAPAPIAETPAVDTPSPTNAAPAAASNPPAPVQYPAPGQPQVAASKQMLPPAAPPAPPPDPASAAAASNNPPAPPLTDEETKAIKNNLRQLGNAAQQYMLDKGMTQASYNDLAGFGTDNYLRPLTPVAGEDYQDTIISQTDTEISVVAPDGTEVIFNL